MQRRISTVILFFIALLQFGGFAAAQSGIEQTDNQSAAAADSETSSKKPAAEAKAETTSEEKSADSEAESADKEDKKAAQDDKKEESSDDEKQDSDKKDKPEKKKKEKKKAKPHTVEAEKLTIEVDLKGYFVADEVEEVILRPDTWTRFKVLEAVEHGTRVSKGDVLVRFDDEKLKEELADEALEQNIGQLSMLQKEEEFPRVKRLLELGFQSAERRFEQVKDDYEYYHSTDRPTTVRLANFRYKSAQQQLASAEEELKQLRQMYEADELTEETEEIVLTRQEFAVETAKLILELNKESRDYTLNVMLPRNDEYYETALEEAELAYKQSKTAFETGSTRKSYDLEKARKSRAKSVERHGDLLSDKSLMTLRAPCDGIVYYGKCTNGKWSQITSMKAKLRPHGSVSANTVLMTIVKDEGLHVETTVGEKEIADIKADLTATVTPTADKELELEGSVSAVESVPGASNKFGLHLDFDTADIPEWLVAGMTCDVSVVVYENEEAVVIPQNLVNTDEEDEKMKYVMLVDPDEDEPVRRKVKLGRKKDKLVEVLKGLEAGDEIVKEEKKDDK